MAKRKLCINWQVVANKYVRFDLIVCSPLSKGAEPHILKISKRGGPEKKFWVGKPKGGGKIFKMEGRNPTFQVEFRDKKRTKMGTST